ncbi:thiamine-phosphate synthase [Marmoricola endophyticus]|uniref:Thiamine-phosphate synthase n=1 Tax=Marmoricola endophyticus TaxID=2040280 RepID=A0A917BII4_9ACTN|nr:thiamine-phosphate synthase [Marmoricola endophyticus]
MAGAGVDVLQVRDKTLTVVEELRVLEEVRGVCERTDTLFCVNDRADLAAAALAEVFHTGQSDLPIAVGREQLGADVVLGRSTHSPDQAAAAETDPDVDYFCVGPVWETPTKPGRPAVGPDAVRAVAATRPTTPWFAIGGIDERRLGQVLDAGAERIVVVRALTEADDPAAAARSLRNRLDTA